MRHSTLLLQQPQKWNSFANCLILWNIVCYRHCYCYYCYWDRTSLYRPKLALNSRSTAFWVLWLSILTTVTDESSIVFCVLFCFILFNLALFWCVTLLYPYSALTTLKGQLCPINWFCDSVYTKHLEITLRACVNDRRVQCDSRTKAEHCSTTAAAMMGTLTVTMFALVYCPVSSVGWSSQNCLDGCEFRVIPCRWQSGKAGQR